MGKCQILLEEKQENDIKNIVYKYEDVEGNLIPILHEVQDYYGYLPEVVQKAVAKYTGVSLAEIYGVVTFYSRFTTEPTGKYKVGICLGTACYVKGAQKVLDEFKRELGIDVNETTEDGEFSIDATRCVGACGLAPVVMVNEKVYGKVEPKEVKAILAKYRK